MSYYPVQLDKSRNFKYGMKAISLVEKKFKKPMSKIDMDDLTMEEMATLMWAGLVHEERALTPDKVMELVDDYSSVTVVATLMGEAITEAFGSGEEEKNE